MSYRCRLLIYLANPIDLAEAWDKRKIFVAALQPATYTKCSLRAVILERNREGGTLRATYRRIGALDERSARARSSRRNDQARGTVPSRPREDSAVAERVQTILSSKELTLYRVSQQSAQLYGRSSPYFIPHNLYYDLRIASFRPSIHQIFALSRISGYRVSDWLRVFGFNREDIVRLQVLLPGKRTILVDSSLTDSNDWVSWFRNRPSSAPIQAIAPLAQLLEPTHPKRIGSLSTLGSEHFLYAKVGREDAFAFPELLPGSIVRVNPAFQGDLVPRHKGLISDRIFLIEHSKGFCCCRLRVVEENVIVPVGSQLSYAQVELQCPLEARVLGVVDLELRPLLKSEEPDVPHDLAKHWRPERLARGGTFGQLLHGSRMRLNLSLREAAAQSRAIGRILDNDRYSISPTSFCEYELRSAPPRDIHKLIALCALCGLEFQSLLKAVGILPQEAGRESMPDYHVSRLARTRFVGKAAQEDPERTGFLEALLDECREIPFFLRNSLEWFGLSASVSLDDFFWVGGERDPLHPCLVKGVLALINRRRKTALHFGPKPWWQQPIYMILRRDGTYIAACGGIENDSLMIHPYTPEFHRAQQFRVHDDAEVIGQIVAIARRLP